MSRVDSGWDRRRAAVKKASSSRHGAGQTSSCKITTVTLCMFFVCLILGLGYLAWTVYRSHTIPPTIASLPTTYVGNNVAKISTTAISSPVTLLSDNNISNNTTQIKSKPKKGFKANKPKAKSNNESQLKIAKKEPSLPQAPFTTSSYNGSIYLNWYLHSDMFHYVNYKSLESWLALYPLAKLHVQIVAPEAAEYYKVGNILSKQTFQKYIKNGLPIQVDIIHSGVQMLLRKSLPGYAFWKDSLQAYNQNNHITIMGKTMHIPFHVTFHHILVTLYDTGGMYSDFAWLHVREMLPGSTLNIVSASDPKQAVSGFDIRWNCPDETDGVSNCYASYILVYTKQHPTLMCMLRKYEDPAFLQCMHEQDLRHNVQCIQQEMQLCHQLVKNVLQTQIVDMDSATLPRDNSLPIISLGIEAFAASWEQPAASSAIGSFIAAHNQYLQSMGFQYLLTKLKLPEGQEVYSMDHNPFPNCSHYFTSKTQSSSWQKQASASCAIHFVMPGFMKAGSSFLFDTLMVNHPMLIRTLRGVQFKESGCYTPEKMKISRFNRMHCFPFAEAHDFKYYGDATVYYAGRQEIPGYLLQDNPEIKVIFTIRNPIARSISQHRFDYEAFRSKGFADFNELIAYALNRDNGRLMLWYDKAEAITKEVDATRKAAMRLELLSLFNEGLTKGSISTIYKKTANVVMNSLYFLHIFLWSQSIPLRNLRILNVETLYVRNIQLEDKMWALSTTPIIHQFNTSALMRPTPKQQAVDHRLDNQEIHKKKSSRISNVDHKYLLYQVNAIYKFMGLPELNRKRILLGGGHESEALVPQIHQINASTKARLEAFYSPFMILLDELMLEMRSQTLPGTV